MHALSFKKVFAIALLISLALLLATALQAWTGPTATAPSGNASAPINVGSTDQVKNAGLSVNALTVFGTQYIQDKLGIGRTSPVVALDVNGTLRLASGGETCQAVTEGGLRYNSTSKVVEFCNGTSWAALGAVATPGTTQYSTPGTYSFTVPTFTSMTVTVKGAGGGGAGGSGWTDGSPVSNGGGGGSGGASSFNSTILGNGGGGAGASDINGQTCTSPAGASGTASGGTTNTTGGGATGGSGGAANYAGCVNGGAGGAGGQAVKTYSTGGLTVGSSITVVVGNAGGAGAGGGGGVPGSAGSAGSNGSVTISWQ